MGKLFGTDGIRGIPWNYPFTEDFISKIGYAATLVLANYNRHPDKSPVVLIGMDSRASGRRIKKALVEGIWANKFKVLDLGVVSTPAVAYLVKRENADFGIVISASHNPPEFNGIKFFSRDGLKLNDAIEARIEALLLSGKPLAFRHIKHAIQKKDYSRDYIDFIKSTLPKGFSLKGVKLVLDCANGAAYKTAPKIFKELGADITVIGAEPDGKNINIGCGALYTEAMQKETLFSGAYCGISLDGDADRCMFVDEKGQIVRCDIMTAWLAEDFLRTNPGSTIVYDLRSSKVLAETVRAAGGVPRRERVGHAFMKKAMADTHAVFGGELSGHSYFRDNFHADSAAIVFARAISVLSAAGKPLSKCVAPLMKYSHSGEINFQVDDKASKMKEVETVFKDAQIDHLDGVTCTYPDWWCNVRPSNTEPLLRLTLEAETPKKMKEKLARLEAILGKPVDH